MPKYLVSARAYRDFIVEAEDRESAIELASNEYSGGFDWEIDQWEVEEELKDERAVKLAKSCGAVDIYDA